MAIDNLPLRSITPTIDIYIRLAQFPILSDQIRERMRQELYQRGFADPEEFERDVERLSVQSQRREGLRDPYGEEAPHIWQARKARVRDYHTDASFANNLGTATLELLIEEVLDSQSGRESNDLEELTFNPEITPWELLFRQGEIYEAMPAEEQEKIKHHLEGIKAVLIRRLLSDQLPFVGVARKIFSIRDLRQVYEGLIGTGKIGGKAAGMLLALKILRPVDEQFGPGALEIPHSYFIGTDVIYEFFLMNRLEHFMNQKYLPLSEIRKEYPQIVSAFMQAELPDYIVERLRGVLQSLGNTPLIVRSSSLLEDNFGLSFAGKYTSYFCPNQGPLEENLQCLMDAIRRIYASSLNPDALQYRRNNQLLDYDERMAILLQRATGEQHGRYFFPSISGVAFSQNPFRWSPDIQAKDGFLRIVCGLGTRAVERVSQDYPRLVALSHPHLRPETTPEAIRRYSQSLMDVFDLVENKIVTLPAREVLPPDYAALPLIASFDRGEHLEPVPPGHVLEPSEEYVLTFDGLAADEQFIQLMRAALRRLEKVYRRPVDIEFVLEKVKVANQYLDGQNAVREPEDLEHARAPYRLHVLECRPLRVVEPFQAGAIPAAVDTANLLFSTPCLLPSGQVTGIRYAIFIDPERYLQLGNEKDRRAVAAAIGRLNERLPARSFVLIGPGRWGSANSLFSVPVRYSDICGSATLIELASAAEGQYPELAYGTDFYQDLVEAGIYDIPIGLDHEGGILNWRLLRESANQLAVLSPEDAVLTSIVRVIDIPAATGKHLRIAIDDDSDRAFGYLT
jgi:hypothetical protein